MADYYDFEKSIRRVAIIGAGPSGVPAARQLRDAGLEVVLYDRQSEVGGVWNWREETTGPLSVPTPPPSTGAFTPVLRARGIDLDPNHRLVKQFNPPNPCYWNLTNNVPTKTLAFKDYPYPPDTPDSVPHWELASYIHKYWAHFGLQSVTRLNTRVEQAFRRGDGKWEIRSRSLQVKDPNRLIETFSTETFDAVVVATGHYNAPLIPRIPGADDWYKQWPTAIIHSQGYRRPETYTGQTVLIIGAGTSGMDIAQDLSSTAARILVSSRIDKRAPTGYQHFREAQRSRRPVKSEAVAEIRKFAPPRPGQSVQEGEIELSDGTLLKGVDVIIFCTGYQYSYPFLSQYHRDPNTEPLYSNVDPLVERGDFVHNLFRDVFYIPDPTLTFLGISVNTSAFSFFEYQSISIARVFAGTARLPSQPLQREALSRTVAKKGPGKFRHFLGQEGEREYVRDTVAWLNRDAKWAGVDEIEGHTAEWIHESDQIAVKIAQKYGVTADGLSDLSGNADWVDAPSSNDDIRERVDIEVFEQVVTAA